MIIDTKPSYLFATPPSSCLTKKVCDALGARTYHWGMFARKDARGWIVSESTSGKGTTLDRFVYERVFVYRITALEPQLATQMCRSIMSDKIIGIHADCGLLPYDWQEPVKALAWWLAKHYLGMIIPVIHDGRVNCQEWVVLLATMLDTLILPPNEHPMSVNLEQSEYLEYLGETSAQEANT